MIKEIVFNLTEKQTIAYRYLTNEESCSVLFGGAKGGGKSYFLCVWTLLWTYRLIKLFGLTKSKYPLPLGFIGRKRAVDFNDTTMETFKKVVPAHLIEIKPHDKEIIFEETAKVLYGGLDDEQNINKFNSAEFAFFAIDQAEETLRKELAVLRASLRLTYNGIAPPYKELYTANPAECWLKDDFVLGNRENGYFVPALADDNPYLPANYKQTLRSAFAFEPDLLKAYLEGDWDAFSNIEDALVKISWVNKCRNNNLGEQEEDDIRIVSADIATKHGSNCTAILYRFGHTIASIEEYQNMSLPLTTGNIQRKYRVKNASSVVIDSDGVGEGVGDMLTEKKIPHYEFHGGYAYQAMDTQKFRNLRTQFYWVVAKKMERGLYDLSKLPDEKFQKLKSQLCAIKVKKPDGLGRFQIETKEDMRARGIMSPDIADSLMMSEYAYWMENYSHIQEYKYR